MIQLIDILKKHFDKCYLFKPDTSSMNNSEKYLILNGFIGIDKKLLDEIKKIGDSKYKYPKLLYPVELINPLTINWVLAANIKMGEIQLRKINEIINTIEFYDFKKVKNESLLEKQNIIAEQWINNNIYQK